MIETYKQNIVYQLVEGETLESVCNDFKVSINHIKRINEIDSASEGDFIFLDFIDLKIHVVKPNQTLEDIAILYNTSVNELKQKNNIDKVFLGQQIII